MPIFSDDQLRREIKAQHIFPLYLFYGEESHLMSHAISLLLKKVVSPSFAEFNLQKFDGASFTFNQLQTAYEALPMMAEYKAVVVKDWNLEKLSKTDFDQLIAMISDPNPSTVLIFCYPSLEIDVKKSSKYKKVCAIIEKSGIVCDFALKDKTTLKKAVLDRCAKGQVTLSPAVCEKIIEQCGASLTTLLQETDKLIFHAGTGGEITREDVEKLCTPSIQNTAFDLSNAILQNQYGKAFVILDHLLYLRTEPLMILGALNMSFTDLYRMKAAQGARCTSDDVIKDFQYRAKFRITKLYRTVSQFSIGQIRGCIESLEKADRLLKSSKLDSRIVLEQMLGEMIAAASPRKK